MLAGKIESLPDLTEAYTETQNSGASGLRISMSVTLGGDGGCQALAFGTATDNPCFPMFLR